MPSSKGGYKDSIRKSNADEVSWMLMMVYNLWQPRNDVRDSNLIADPNRIAMKTIAGLEEW